MTQTIKSTDEIEYAIIPPSEKDEIRQNIIFILRTLKTSVPLDRDMGISGSYYGNTLPVAEALLYQEILDEIEEREPRANVESITFEVESESGKLIPILEVTI